MKLIPHPDGRLFIIKLATDADAPVVRTLVNSAYKELADMGLNYTATYQDEETTRERMAKGRTYLLCDGEKVIGTIHLREVQTASQEKCAYIGQFGILPAYKRNKLGSLMMDFVEEIAQSEGYRQVQLDTAKPAQHLVELYLKRGYHIIGDTHYEGKTYESWIFEKNLEA